MAYNSAEAAKFLSTPSARRATLVPPDLQIPDNNFYPRPPRGGRRLRKRKDWATRMISIHALREEGDRDLYRFIADFGIFLSTPSARRATWSS